MAVTILSRVEAAVGPRSWVQPTSLLQMGGAEGSQWRDSNTVALLWCWVLEGVLRHLCLWKQDLWPSSVFTSCNKMKSNHENPFYHTEVHHFSRCKGLKSCRTFKRNLVIQKDKCCKLGAGQLLSVVHYLADIIQEKQTHLRCPFKVKVRFQQRARKKMLFKRKPI